MTSPVPRLLVVDEEESVLAGFRRTLRPLTASWEIDFVTTPQEARGCFETAPYDVVITELRFSSGSGESLLAELREHHPQCIRLVLSSFIDAQAMGRLLTLAHLAMHKPISPEQLVACIHRTQRLLALFASPRIAEVFERFGELPPAPRLFSELQRVLESPSSGITDVARVISQDPLLAARLLRLVNSAGFGLSQSISSIDKAITMLGISQIKSILLGMETFGLLERVTWPAGFSYVDFQDRAQQRASLARSLISDSRDAEQAYMAGLLLHLGELIIASYLPDIYQTVNERAANDVPRQLELESTLIGANRAELGGFLLHLWNLPTPLVEAVACQFEPKLNVRSSSRVCPLAAAVTAEAALRCVASGANASERLQALLATLLPASLLSPGLIAAALNKATRLLQTERTAA